MILSNYESAAITIIGMTMDSVGGLYLAYDLQKKIVFSFVAGCIIAGLIFLGEHLGGDKQAFYNTLRTSLVVTFGVMTITVFAPTIEWWADNVPDKRMGYIGVILFLCGFAVQSIPSMLTLLSY